jgi:hypothetical protein
MVSPSGLTKLQGSVKAACNRLKGIVEQHVEDQDTFDMQLALKQFALETIFKCTYGVQMPTKVVRIRATAS